MFNIVFSQTLSSLEGFSQRFPFFDLISLFVNSRPLSVNKCVISKGKKTKHSSMNIFAFSDVLASYTLNNKVLVALSIATNR